MSDKIVSTYRGFGHRVHIVRRDAVQRNWALLDNRRVLVSSTMEETIKRQFCSRVQSIVLQTSLEL